MPLLGFDHINLQAPQDELDRTRDFYVNVLGLVEGYRPGFRRAGYWLYIGDQPLVHLTVETMAPAHSPRSTIDHIAFACNDFAAVTALLDANSISYEMTIVPGRAARQIFLADPLGNGIELNFAGA